MDGSLGNEGMRVDDSGTGLLKSKTDSGDNIEREELMEEQSQDMRKGDGDDDGTCQEAGAGVPGDEMEVDGKSLFSFLVCIYTFKLFIYLIIR